MKTWVAAICQLFVREIFIWKIFIFVVQIYTFVSGGSRISQGRGPQMWVLFGEIVCENKRIGSRKEGGVCWAYLPRSANVKCSLRC